MRRSPRHSRGARPCPGRQAEFNGSTRALCADVNIPRLRRLKKLSLYNNKLERLTKIGNLAACPLEELSLGRNLIAHVPSEVSTRTRTGCLCGLRYARSLSLVRVFVRQFGKLVTLRSLWLDTNNLDEFPAPLLRLTALEELRLSNNKIPVLPYQIERLSKLKLLAMDNNALRALPHTICSLTDMETLYFRYVGVCLCRLTCRI